MERHRASFLISSIAFVALLGLGGCLESSSNDDVGDVGPLEPADDIGVLEQEVADQCGHSICETGAAVASTCDSCVAQICAVDSFCCTTSWDSVCVGEVGSICGLGPVAVTSSTSVSAIKIRIKTGGDDLRSGSQAYGSFQLSSGVSLPKVSLNNGVGFPGNSVRTAVVSLSPSRSLGSLKGFTLEWDGAPRNIFDSYDNWDANEFRFFHQPDTTRCPTFLGAAFVPGRMTGSRTIASTAVTFP